jgi:SAM-dependent methyltransferase
MADRSSSPNPRKQSDSSSLLLELAKVFCLKKFSRPLINNKPSSNTSNNNNDKVTSDVYFNNILPNDLNDLKSFPKYNFPSFNDDEYESLNFEHYLFRFQWQSNFSSPIEQNLLSGGVKVLDVGCGNGTWILDMAREYHHTNIYIGIDILPILPDDNSRLSNTGFIQCDLLDGIPFPDSTFDFVCERFLIYPDLTDSQWKYLFSEMKRVLKPGGYLEIMEYRVDYDNPGPITRNRNDQGMQLKNVFKCD